MMWARKSTWDITMFTAILGPGFVMSAPIVRGNIYISKSGIHYISATNAFYWSPWLHWPQIHLKDLLK
jgi:hypothetical protein